MVGRYVFSVCLCVLDNLHKKGIDCVTLPSSVIINNYSDLQKNCLGCTSLHHGYVSIDCKKHEEQLLKLLLHEICRSATNRCSCVSHGNRITACNECFDFYQKNFLCDSIKICIGKGFLKGMYRNCVIYNRIKFKEFAFSGY